MKKLFIAIAILTLVGCSSSWIPQTKPETKEERKCVERVQQTLLITPTTLAGHDQDWDDAIKAANAAALVTCCRTRLYEWYSGNFTGQVKEF